MLRISAPTWPNPPALGLLMLINGRSSFIDSPFELRRSWVLPIDVHPTHLLWLFHTCYITFSILMPVLKTSLIDLEHLLLDGMVISWVEVPLWWKKFTAARTVKFCHMNIRSKTLLLSCRPSSWNGHRQHLLETCADGARVRAHTGSDGSMENPREYHQELGVNDS